ncbi:hypothetical protein [Candidatus Magnetominusculus xianensis]|uniref:Uncharacterized protein n=1 Tax=Candidatus Magnetominusculus xianensis TaxID=1748249 RepID=A0ABR5SE46_9BACT|nr:hypothetical protein [Candidatus Magnetominusculus xianensis]KWT84068.1 hypothetical protein ASN18_1995 [Candidatus Magnetominusculus xianensis]MBF0402361.1 hypothetical protein [Nitrospirota bacterium]
MSQRDYESNLETAVSYLKLQNGIDARLSVKKALSQVPEEEKTEDNKSYLKILALCARFAIEEADISRAGYYIRLGLKLKRFHVDLLFLDIMLSKVTHRYGDMLTTILSYLIAIDLPDRELYEYDFLNSEALKEVYDVYLPLAYSNTQNHAPIMEIIRDTAERLKKITTGVYVDKAYDIMRAIDLKSN